MAEKSIPGNSYMEIWKVTPNLFEQQILFWEFYADIDEGTKDKDEKKK
jgi:hypothetical protein